MTTKIPPPNKKPRDKTKLTKVGTIWIDKNAAPIPQNKTIIKSLKAANDATLSGLRDFNLTAVDAEKNRATAIASYKSAYKKIEKLLSEE